MVPGLCDLGSSARRVQAIIAPVNNVDSDFARGRPPQATRRFGVEHWTSAVCPVLEASGDLMRSRIIHNSSEG
jgi:hypothetical protein